MANECLVTKLKGVVQNDNLEKLGEIRAGAQGYYLLMKSEETGKIYTENGESVLYTQAAPSVKGSEFPITSVSTSASYYGEDTIVEKTNITNKYALKILTLYGGCNIDLDKWTYLNSIEQLDLTQTQGAGPIYNGEFPLAQAAKSTISILKVRQHQQQNNKATFNVDNLHGCLSLVEFMCDLGSYGNIENVNSPAMTLFSASASYNLRGELNTMIQNILANNPAAHRLTLYLMGSTGCTDDGNPLTSEYYHSKGGNYTIYVDFDGNGGYTKTFA